MLSPAGCSEAGASTTSRAAPVMSLVLPEPGGLIKTLLKACFSCSTYSHHFCLSLLKPLRRSTRCLSAAPLATWSQFGIVSAPDRSSRGLRDAQLGGVQLWKSRGAQGVHIAQQTIRWCPRLEQMYHGSCHAGHGLQLCWHVGSVTPLNDFEGDPRVAVLVVDEECFEAHASARNLGWPIYRFLGEGVGATLEFAIHAHQDGQTDGAGIAALTVLNSVRSKAWGTDPEGG